MSEAIKLIPKRKLVLNRFDGADATIQHILDNQDSILPSTGLSSLTLSGAAPILYFSETDQVDPTGRFRFRAYNGAFVLEEALTANWATDVNRLQIGVDASTVQLLAYSVTGKVVLGGGDAFGAGAITCHGNTHATYPGGILFETIGASATKTRLLFDSGTDTGNITVSNAKFTAPNIYSNSLWGQGTGQMSLRANSAVTDATEYSMVLYVLNATADTWLDMITLTPSGASPTMDFNSRPITNITPSTTGGTGVVASYGPAAVASITVKNGLITAIS